ncbi:MAG: polysaccharide biosynthesis/export family protein [Gammaproteobacteria bacterium]|nr:polysaccharide biosynthesis/export family protein [Gammaproteobacteria bacterium]MCP5136678.1 polysaccharide biosynthesis/export family protein [Gammaproteobacteria bacterium]
MLMLGACTSEEVRRPPPKEHESNPPGSALPDARKMMSPEDRLASMAELRKATHIDFTLGKGDVLSVSVYNEPDLSVNGVPIRPDGKFSFPLVGDVLAENRSVDEVKAELTERLLKYLKDPQVSVIVQQFASLEYTLIGEVVHPGVYPLVTNVTITGAMAKAGGLTKGQFHASSVELADLTHAFISRDGSPLPVDFVALFRDGDLRYDIPLHPGDYIYIPSGLSKEIYVLGEVQRPDLFAFREDMQLSKALTIANGFTVDADMTQVHIARGSLADPELYVINMEDVFKGRVTDIELEPGDIIYVPASGLTEWSRILNRIMPSVQAIQTGIILQQTASGSSK